MPYGVECTHAGLMSHDAKSPYDEEPLHAGLMIHDAKAYSNAEA